MSLSGAGRARCKHEGVLYTDAVTRDSAAARSPALLEQFLTSPLLTEVIHRGQVEMRRENDRHLMATKRLFRLLDTHGLVGKLGEAHVPDTLRFPVPDLIVEVLSPSTEARDRGVKFDDPIAETG
jgi:hypothetical protein